MNKIPDHLIAIVLAARDHLVTLAEPPARAWASARAVVNLIDAWASDCLMPGQLRVGVEQLSGAERDMYRAAVDATAKEKGLGNHLLGVADWTPETLAAARVSARVGVAVFNAAEALCRAARQACAGDHARLVAASAMTSVEYVAEARLSGAPVR